WSLPSLPALRETDGGGAGHDDLALAFFFVDLEVDETLAALFALADDPSGEAKLLAGESVGPVLEGDLHESALRTDPIGEGLRHQGLLQGAVDEEVGVAFDFHRVGLVVVDAVAV